MFKILREIASNLHSNDSKMYRTYKNPPPQVSCYTDSDIFTLPYGLLRPRLHWNLRNHPFFPSSSASARVLFSLALIGSSVSWCERRSWVLVPAWCSCWSWGGPQSAAAGPVRRSPAAGRPRPRRCSLRGVGASKVRTEESIFAPFVHYLKMSISFPLCFINNFNLN